MQNLAALVNRGEAKLSVGNSSLSETLPVLDEMLLNNLNHIIRATTNSTKIDKQLRQVLEREIAVKALINKLLFEDFPELVVLKVHGSGTTNHHLERPHSVTIEGRHLPLDHRDNNVPEVWGLLKLILRNVLKAVGDLLWRHDVLTIALVDVDNVLGVPGIHKHEVHLMEGHGDVVIVIVVATSMDGASCNRCHHAESLLHHHRLHESES